MIYAPTDLVWVLGRVLVLNDSDLATAYNYSKSYAISSYDPARELPAYLQSILLLLRQDSPISGICCVQSLLNSNT